MSSTFSITFETDSLFVVMMFIIGLMTTSVALTWLLANMVINFKQNLMVPSLSSVPSLEKADAAIQCSAEGNFPFSSFLLFLIQRYRSLSAFRFCSLLLSFFFVVIPTTALECFHSYFQCSTNFPFFSNPSIPNSLFH